MEHGSVNDSETAVGDDVMEDGSVDDGETAVDDDVTMGDSANVTVGVGIEDDDYYCYHHDSNLHGQLPDEESISAVEAVPVQESPD
eukprot:10535209-Ditylum_brightwellii.AAC.1